MWVHLKFCFSGFTVPRNVFWTKSFLNYPMILLHKHEIVNSVSIGEYSDQWTVHSWHDVHANRQIYKSWGRRWTGKPTVLCSINVCKSKMLKYFIRKQYFPLVKKSNLMNQQASKIVPTATRSAGQVTSNSTALKPTCPAFREKCSVVWLLY